MATHSSTLAWKIPWEEPGRLQSMRSLRVSGFTFTFLFHALEKKWQPTPVLLRGKSHGRSLVGCSPWGRKESDTTEQLYFTSL